MLTDKLSILENTKALAVSLGQAENLVRQVCLPKNV